ncbi:glycosyltransferase [Microbacterium sp. CPCC 204701]|uniref:glycosyltransferase n=1 Tax=Microbacterium sp. CPCC 204701 TaxID=2493084 RepID=UPI0013E3B09A|nr:glycosyltransferase family A protein [Microbacterium sp. CPCC 204701]
MAEQPVDASVVIPAFNAEATLADQLSALAGQDANAAFEVLVSDNGSTDGTARVIEAFADRIPGLRLVDASSRRGASAARNVGAAAARGRLLLFCDADDVVSTGWVRAMTAALAHAPFAAGAVEHSLLNPGRDWDFGWAEPTFRDPALPQLPAGGSGNMGIHATAFAEVGGFDESLTAAEDLDFSWRVQLAGHRLVGVPDAVVHVRKRGGVRDAVRQARAKGAGSRVVSHRFALVRDAYESADAERPVPAGVGSGGGALPPPDRLARIPAKALEILRSPARVTPYLAGWAYRRGFRHAEVDGIPQFTPPDRLPPAV